MSKACLTDLKNEEHEMIVDWSCSYSLGGRPYLEDYFRVNGIKKEDLKRYSCDIGFNFGDTKYESEEIVEIPVKMKVKGGVGSKLMYVPTYVVEGNVPFLLGSNTLKEWQAVLNMREETLEVDMFDEKNPMEFLAPRRENYMRLHLGRLNQVFLETEKKIRDELVQERAEIVEEEKSTDYELSLIHI